MAEKGEVGEAPTKTIDYGNGNMNLNSELLFFVVVFLRRQLTRLVVRRLGFR